MSIPSKFYRMFHHIPAFALPVLVYILILILPIPYNTSAFFASYSAPYLLLTGGLYYACFRLPTRYRWILGSSLTLALFGLKLSYLWGSSFSDGRLLGGLLPFSDGFYYYINARLMNVGSVLPSNFVAAGGRPLFSGFIATALLLTQHNLQWTLAIVAWIVGFACYYSADQVRESFGARGAAVFMTFMFFYVLEFIGYMYTETLGFALGCLGFVMLLNVTRSLDLRKLIMGLVVLMLGVSIRAGAFFIFPTLILWSGWAFREHKRFNFRVAAITAFTTVATFLIVNTIYSSLIVGPGHNSLGNFAYTLYGQVHGGSGYHSAIEELGTRDSTLVLQETARFFLIHPLSFLIGAAKAYRDFFLPLIGIFTYISPGGRTWSDILLWAFGTTLGVWGTIRVVRKIRHPDAALLAAVLAGILLSIPFLPPIDSGTRYYAGTMAFFYAVLAYPITEKHAAEKTPDQPHLMKFSFALSLTLLAASVVLPIFIKQGGRAPEVVVPVCGGEQVPFAIHVDPGSYFDVYPDDDPVCRGTKTICLEEFQANATSRDAADVLVVQQVVDQAQASNAPIRTLTANNLISGKFHLFVGPVENLPAAPERLVTGCAQEEIIRTRPSVFLVGP